ncbi:phBC6A51 family helix-turn-helix protein [Priestia megaterium]|uniref:phBC6A51 family helix-turn-helix protein n=1 Tax=Priestia megaterium TaxID=1404 RepID=UPI0015D048E0|nr:phBC6A51 family helix-turn-helix protein [Priestia megaterium]
MFTNIDIAKLEEQLRPNQLKAINLMVESEFASADKKTLEEIAEECGVSRITLYQWRKNPVFNQLLKAYSSQHLSSYRALADAQLLKLIKGTSANGIPSIKSLELFYKLQQDLNGDKTVTLVSGDNGALNRADIEAELAELEAGLED